DLDTDEAPIAVFGTGISDSVLYAKILDKNDHIRFAWNPDSNRYDFFESIFSIPLELVNNVEDSTKFDFIFEIDTSAHFHSKLIVGRDSSELPYTLKCRSRTRRISCVLSFFSEAEGFVQGAQFNAKLKILIHNTSTNYSLIRDYILSFGAMPVKSVRPSSQDLQIVSLAGDHFITVSSNFLESQFARLQFFDALGIQRKLPNSEIEIPAGENSQKIETGNLPSGWYMLQIKMKDRIFNKNFIVLR